MKLKLLKQSLVCLSMVVFLAGTGCAEQPKAKPDSAGFQDGSKMTVVGRIDYRENMGGYYVKSDNPPAILFIDNQIPKTLGKLSQSKKLFTIQGHATVGADYLFIEKIDGKAYKGE